MAMQAWMMPDFSWIGKMAQAFGLIPKTRMASPQAKGTEQAGKVGTEPNRAKFVRQIEFLC